MNDQGKIVTASWEGYLYPPDPYQQKAKKAKHRFSSGVTPKTPLVITENPAA